MQSRFGAAVLGLVAGVTVSYVRLRTPGGSQPVELAETEEKPLVEAETAPEATLFKYGIPQSHVSTHTYTSHSLSYDRSRRVPVWVAERITRDHVTGPANRKRSRFKPDPSLPAPFSSANEDYWNSGWSRGHMAPAGNYKHCQRSMDDSFLLTNIVPQDLDNNSGYWNRLECYCRDLTERYEEVSVITGPLFLPQREEESGKKFVRYQVIGRNNVAVPTHLYKIIVAEGESKLTAMGVFIIPNKPLKDVDLTRFQVSLEELESHSGITFHSKLDRSQMRDLCVDDSCKLMSVEKFALFVFTKRLKSARSLAEVERVWEEVQRSEVTPNDRLRQTYKKRRMELQQKQ